LSLRTQWMVFGATGHHGVHVRAPVEAGQVFKAALETVITRPLPILGSTALAPARKN